MSQRREYPLQLLINQRWIEKVIIDSHYEEKHMESINDDIILALVKQLDRGLFEPVTERDGFQYFETEPLYFNEKPYKLIWLLEQNSIYIGVINAYRR